MAKYGVAAGLLCVYVLASAWIVRNEGESYRAALRRERRAAVETPAPSPRVADAATEAKAPAAVPPETITPPATTSPPLAAAVGPAHVEPSTAVAPVVPAPAPAPAPATPDPLWKTPEMKEVWDLAHMGPEEERRLGRALHALILTFNKRQGTGPYLRRAEEAAEPMLALRARKEIDYTFTILDSDAVNAFSHPGGYIYLTRGLFDLIAEEEDYALQFVIAHEIAHVDLKHAIRCLLDPQVAKLGVGTLTQFYSLILPLGYTEAMDFEADRWAYDRMIQLRRSRHQALAFLRKLEGYARANDFENGRDQLRPILDASPAEYHIRAHPPAWKRLKQLIALSPSAAKPAR